MPSPWITRALEAQAQDGHAAIKAVEPTLDDPIKADFPHHRQVCERCWEDFAAGYDSPHACDCLVCNPPLPADHRWSESCACEACL